MTSVVSLADMDQREERRRMREEQRSVAKAFELVGDLPEPETGRYQSVPEVRLQMIELAKANPGKWIRYNPSVADPFSRPRVIVDKAQKGTGGFGPGFEAAIRTKVAYVRYVGEES